VVALSDFSFVWKAVRERTPLPFDRGMYLYNWVRETLPLEGDMAECGTFKGGSAKLICRAAQHMKKLHIFDTFVGIPVEQRNEGEHRVGDFTCSREEVVAFLEDCPNIQIYEGLVPDTLEAVKDLTFSLVNLDMDIYVPTIAALHFFWPRMTSGGIIVLDDVTGLYSITLALNEFKEQYGVEIVHTTNDQAIIRK
jgi:O-methyltransferase